MVWYYGRETSVDREIKNLELLRDNPEVRKQYINLTKFINFSTYIVMGAFIIGVLTLTIWLLSWMFKDGFNIYAILFNPLFIIFAVIWLGCDAGRAR